MREKKEMEKFLRTEIQDQHKHDFYIILPFMLNIMQWHFPLTGTGNQSYIQTNLTRQKKFFLKHLEQSFVSTTPSLRLRKRQRAKGQ